MPEADGMDAAAGEANSWISLSGAPHAPRETVRALRRKTLTLLRWLAIAGQSIAVLVAYFVLKIDLPLLACVGMIALAALYNVVEHIADDGGARLTEASARRSLAVDLVQLIGLLYLTGGLANPFAVFLLAPVAVAASILSLQTTVLITGGAILGASALAYVAPPLVSLDGTTVTPPPLYLAGFWTAIVIAVSFQAIYTRRAANESFNMSAALGAAQAALEREQRVSAIGALAAATAHELGTPLATITVVATELRRDLAALGDQADLEEDAELIAEQAKRCRDILQRLSSVSAPEESHLTTAPITAVIEEAAGPHRDRRARVVMRLNGSEVTADNPGGSQPEIVRRPEIIHGLRNLIQNAVDFAGSTVWIDVETAGSRIAVSIGDDGAGFSDQILAELGEPFATTRGGGGREGYSGMGLGVFIAKTLLERTGARLAFYNNGPRRRRPAPGAKPSAEGGAAAGVQAEPTGAVVRVVWPRQALETSARRWGKAEPVGA